MSHEWDNWGKCTNHRIKRSKAKTRPCGAARIFLEEAFRCTTNKASITETEMYRGVSMAPDTENATCVVEVARGDNRHEMTGTLNIASIY